MPGTDCAIAEDRTGQIVAVANHAEVRVALGDRTIRIGPLDDCRNVSLSPDGQWLATGSHINGGVTIWSLPDGAKVTKLPIDGGCRSRLQPRREMADERARIQPFVGGRDLARGAADRGRFCCFSPDGRTGIVQETSKFLGLVEIETGRMLARLESPDQHSVQMARLSAPTARAWS